MLHMARYVAHTMISSIAMVMVVLTVLGGLFTFIGEQDSIGVGNYHSGPKGLQNSAGRKGFSDTV